MEEGGVGWIESRGGDVVGREREGRRGECGGGEGEAGRGA